ncbi:MAG: hypothetical protein ACR2IK_01310 [Chloroflexota bacterium]
MDEATLSMFYEIRLRGVLGEMLLSAFPTLSGTAQGGVTVLSGCLPDQAALYGVLNQVESLGLELLSVHRVADPSDGRISSRGH